MTTTQDKIAQYLREARAMEVALVRTLHAHRAMTPAGAYRSALDRHLSETREHADRIRRRLADLGQAQGLADIGYGLAQRLVGEVLSLGKGPLDLLRGTSAEEKLLKNAKDECATEAYEIATYDALEQLALLAGDARTAVLAAEHRADEERMLLELRTLLPALTAAVVGAEVPPEERGEPRGAAAEEEAARGADTTGQRDEAAAVGEPFPGYDELTVDAIAARLNALTPAQLRDVEAYERAHKQRRGVLIVLERLLERGDAPPGQPIA